MGLTVTVLGSSGMFATALRASSGYLVEIDGTRLWMDAGAGTWRNLLQVVDYASLDGVLLTHCHPDHTSDIFQAFHAREYGGPEPLEPIPLWAPRETIERLTAFVPDLERSFELRIVAAGDSRVIAGASVSFHDTAHPAETLGIRLAHDRGVLAYSADCGPSTDFALARAADVFICEATLQDSDKPWEGHMSASGAGAVAGRQQVGRLVLSHLPPGRDHTLSLEQASAAARGVRVELANDGERLEVGG